MKRFLAPAVLALTSLVAVVLLSVPLSSVEEQITSWKYRIRGVQQADTNIVIVYIDNEAIRELGWPVRRNFYALLINALADLNVKAIGVDILFEQPHLEYPEYDQLLTHVVGSARNVVLSSYFEKLVLRGWQLARLDADAQQSADTGRTFDYPLVSDVYRLGDELHLPMPALLHVSAGIGHVNVEEDGSIPLFIASEDMIVPSLGTELLRIYAGAGRHALRFEHNRLAVRKEGRLVEFDTDEGRVSLNYPGRISSFTLYPFLEVLKSYDALRAGRTPVIPVSHLKNKIVLIGVIAEGRSETFATPVDPRFPSVGFHAVFLDNALRSGFLRTTPGWVVVALCFVVGSLCVIAAVQLRSSVRLFVPAAVIVLFVFISFALFFVWNIVLPIVSVTLAGVIATGAALVYRHRFIQEQLKSALSEKERISAELRDREAKVAALERELVSLEKNKSADKTAELLEEIRRYKSEIHALTSQKDDMEEAPGAGAASEANVFEGIVYGSGGAMQPVVDFVAKIAGSDATVLILGESGTGKEMVARAIHRRSTRAQQAFVAVNCGALAEHLLESELFGHEKGAFTGAVKEKPGRFELADGGTILLDEIGEVNEAFQLKLLRVLQEGEFERVGGTKTMKVNVRVIAATNKDLKQLVNEKRFRQDLYYRLNVLSVELPPLRERQEDIPLLINHFLEKEGSGMKLSKNVLDVLQNYAWRGNIRELESAITRAVLLARADKRTMIVMKDLSPDLSSAAKGAIAIEDQILESLREKGFSRSAITETADELGGLNRGTVAEYLRGQCLKAFVDHTYDLETAVRYISLSSDSAVNERVRKRMQEYLANIADAVDTSQPWESLLPSLRPKMKNLPQKYHAYVEQSAEAYYRGVWGPDRTGA
jgi:transcriptional regulator with PAS, ATPase and Fis domain/CHASE2 domain-containing sensor protein